MAQDRGITMATLPLLTSRDEGARARPYKNCVGCNTDSTIMEERRMPIKNNPCIKLYEIKISNQVQAKN